MIRRAIALWLVAAAILAATAAGALEVSYTVTVDDPAQGLFHVAGRITGAATDAVDLAIPRWSPGYYHLQEYYKGITSFAARAGDRELTFEKPDDLTWRVPTGGAKEITYSYDVTAQKGLGMMEPALTDEYGFISGEAAFMYVEGDLAARYGVKFVLPESWKAASALPEKAGVFHAPDYDTLVDSPFQLGLFDRHDYTLDGVPYSIIIARNDPPPGMTEPLPTFDVDALFQKITPLIREQIHIFGTKPPFDRYVFILHLGPRSGAGSAIEHANSTVAGGMWLGPSLDVIAHEFFHLWNVKRIRPSVLWPFDYSKECRTANLWFCEGVTSYYQTLTLRRAGITDDQTFYGALAGQIAQLLQNPNRKQVTADQSSWKAWEGNPFGYGNLNYYNKGLLIGLCLDLKIRQATGGRKGLDDAMRYLYREYYKKNRGYPEDGIRTAVSTAAGTNLSAFYDLCARSTEELPIEDCLAYAGLHLVVTARDVPFLGVMFDYRGGEGEGSRIQQVSEDGPAAKAGLLAGDRILKVDGKPAGQPGHGGGINTILRPEEIGKEHKLTIRRGEEESELPITVGSRKENDYRVVELEETSEQQRALRSGWLASLQPAKARG